VGTRLGVAEHLGDTLHVFDLRLGAADRDAIEGVLAHSRDLYSLIGDCGAEYRR
jgi:hypothetical protein